MTLLSERIKKAKKLRFTSKSKGQYNTWGTDDIHYTIDLSSGKKEIITPDGYLMISVFYTNCIAHNYSDDLTIDNCAFCKGNTQHTVCYHSLAAIYQSFQEIGKSVSFHSTYRSADRALTLGKFLAKVENQNGRGCVWVVIKDGNQSKLPVFSELPLDSQTNIRLMRGSEDDEGID